MIHKRVGAKFRKKSTGGPLSSANNNVVSGKRRWQKAAITWSAVILAVFIAFGLRAFRLGVSWEISQDEIDYLQISQGVVRTLWVVGWDGGPFYLHPPLFFFMEAAYIKLFGVGGDLIGQIQNVRYLNAALGGLSAGAILWMGRRLAGWPAGIAAGAIFALDPFCIRISSRNFLEAPAMLWVLLGYGVLFSALVKKRGLLSRQRTIAVGVLFGLAILTKDNSAFVTLVPLGICFLLGWALPRLRSVLIGVVALGIYAIYPAIVYAIGDWETFVTQKSAGVLRIAGILQFTGFNQDGGPSFLNTILYRLDEFGTTYILLATGAVSMGVLFFTTVGKTPARRLLLAWVASAYAFLTYATLFGTIEEHFFYYLIIPSIVATTVTTALVLRRISRNDVYGIKGMLGRQLVLGTAPMLFLIVIILWNTLLAYTLIQGALGEQFYYYLLINSALAIFVVGALALQRVRKNDPYGTKGIPDRQFILGAAPMLFLIVMILGNSVLTYAMIQGSLGERFYYYLLIDSALAVSVVAVLLSRKIRSSRPESVRAMLSGQTLLRSVATVFMVTLSLWSVYVWVSVHTTPDNGYQRVVSYVDQLPPESRVAVTSQTAALIIRQHAGEGRYLSVESLQEDDVDYVVVSSYLATRGWREPSPEVYRWIQSNGQLVYGFEGSSSGLLGVWRLNE